MISPNRPFRRFVMEKLRVIGLASYGMSIEFMRMWLDRVRNSSMPVRMSSSESELGMYRARRSHE